MCRFNRNTCIVQAAHATIITFSSLLSALQEEFLLLCCLFVFRYIVSIKLYDTRFMSEYVVFLTAFIVDVLRYKLMRFFCRV